MPPSELPAGLQSPTDLERVIGRLTAVLEEECGDNLSAWGAVSMVLVTLIADMTGADINEICNALKRTDKGIMQ